MSKTIVLVYKRGKERFDTMQQRSSTLGHFNYSSSQRSIVRIVFLDAAPSEKITHRGCAFRYFPSYFRTPFSSLSPFQPKEKKKKLKVVRNKRRPVKNPSVPCSSQSEKLKLSRFIQLRVFDSHGLVETSKVLVRVEKVERYWISGTSERSVDGKLHGTPCISLSHPSAPAVSARSNIGGWLHRQRCTLLASHYVY